MGGMTVDLLPTDDPLMRQTLPSMVQGQANTQAATQAAISAQVAQQLAAQQQQPVSSTGIQAALDAGKVDILGMGIFETPATAFAFANTTIPSYALYGAVALAACVLVYYLHRENYV
jgi:ABC-type amino acid transport substrate-binding protein